MICGRGVCASALSTAVRAWASVNRLTWIFHCSTEICVPEPPPPGGGGGGGGAGVAAVVNDQTGPGVDPLALLAITCQSYVVPGSSGSGAYQEVVRFEA